MGDVTVVQALDGLKFVFILIITAMFSKLLPASAVKDISRPKEFFRQFIYGLDCYWLRYTFFQ
ncbi:MAG: hypothetical protein R3B53_02370 [Candidatus Paceibacterota bacterium]